MPMPKPHAGESQDEFMSRCMGDDTMMSDFPEQDQRVAVCMSQWNDKSIAHRAYSVLSLKSVDDELRILEGIATTPSPDRVNDVVEPEGLKFKLPLPFLFQHDPDRPIGTITAAKRSPEGVAIKVKIAPKGIAPFIDEAWSLIKAGLVRGLSIGFRALEAEFDKATGGIHFLETELFEVSAVTIPANAEATILTVKSADLSGRAVSGIKRSVSVHLGQPSTSRVRANHKGISMAKKTTAEQILDFQTKRNANAAVMQELMDKASDEGRDLLDEESEKYDELKAENARIDKHLERLKEHEALVVSKATPITPDNTQGGEKSAQTRSGVISVKSNEPKGIGIARATIAIMRNKGYKRGAIETAAQMWPDNPEVSMYVKTIIEAGDTTTSGWASQLLPAAQQMSGEFLEMLRAQILIGRIPGLRAVPFNVAVPLQSGSGTYGWIGEGAPKPVTKPTYGSATLRFEKAAGIIVITQELARFSSPSAELLVRNEMLEGLTRFFDTTFISNAAAVTNVAPAGILNGISATAATGTSASAFRANFNTTIQKMITNNRDPGRLVILMSAGIAMVLSSMMNSLGQPEFPTITATGGSYLGLPIITSQAVGTNVVVIDPGDILIAEDPAISIDVSTEASVEMSDAPVAGESSPASALDSLKSLWQNNLVGIRAEQFRTWKVARSSAVEYISGAAYTVS